MLLSLDCATAMTGARLCLLATPRETIFRVVVGVIACLTERVSERRCDTHQGCSILHRFIKVLFIIGLLAGSAVFVLDYYDVSRPTVPDERSGHVFPMFDKCHNRYAYVTALERRSLPVLLCIGVGCIFACVLASKFPRPQP